MTLSLLVSLIISTYLKTNIMLKSNINKLYITKINYNYDCDVFFPYNRLHNKLINSNNKVLTKNPKKIVRCNVLKKKVELSFDYYDLGIYIDEESNDSDNSIEEPNIYTRNNDEFQYLNLLNRILIEDTMKRKITKITFDQFEFSKK